MAKKKKIVCDKDDTVVGNHCSEVVSVKHQELFYVSLGDDQYYDDSKALSPREWTAKFNKATKEKCNAQVMPYNETDNLFEKVFCSDANQFISGSMTSLNSTGLKCLCAVFANIMAQQSSQDSRLSKEYNQKEEWVVNEPLIGIAGISLLLIAICLAVKAASAYSNRRERESKLDERTKLVVDKPVAKNSYVGGLFDRCFGPAKPQVEEINEGYGTGL